MKLGHFVCNVYKCSSITGHKRQSIVTLRSVQAIAVSELRYRIVKLMGLIENVTVL